MYVYHVQYVQLSTSKSSTNAQVSMTSCISSYVKRETAFSVVVLESLHRQAQPKSLHPLGGVNHSKTIGKP